MIFKEGEIYVIKDECIKNKKDWVQVLKDKKGGNYIHIRWYLSKEETLIPQSCIQRKANEKDKQELLAWLI